MYRTARRDRRRRARRTSHRVGCEQLVYISRSRTRSCARAISGACGSMAGIEPLGGEAYPSAGMFEDVAEFDADAAWHWSAQPRRPHARRHRVFEILRLFAGDDRDTVARRKPELVAQRGRDPRHTFRQRRVIVQEPRTEANCRPVRIIAARYVEMLREIHAAINRMGSNLPADRIAQNSDSFHLKFNGVTGLQKSHLFEAASVADRSGPQKFARIECFRPRYPRNQILETPIHRRRICRGPIPRH